MSQKIIVHDYAGHPFQPQLSRALAARGHTVLHAYSRSLRGPQGSLQQLPTDPPTLRFHGTELPRVLNKQAYIQRYFLERRYGQLLEQAIEKFQPDIVISSSAPLDSQAAILRATRRVGAKFVFWLQDVIGIATKQLLGGKFFGAGTLIGRHYVALERRLLIASDSIVSITDDFLPTLQEWRVPMERVRVIPNWAAVDEMPLRSKHNDWARRQGLSDKFCFIYTGTIGLKHNAEHLVKLAIAYRDRPSVAVVVVSEGAKAEWLRRERERLTLNNLFVFPYQPYETVPDVMGAADVLVAVLDPQAGAFSVPSKVLAYHCAGRPILLSVSNTNLAARIVRQVGSGIVVDPGDPDGFLAHAEYLRAAAPQVREQMGRNARSYAERMFNIEKITNKFEEIFAEVLASRPAPVDAKDVALADERT